MKKKTRRKVGRGAQVYIFRSDVRVATGDNFLILHHSSVIAKVLKYPYVGASHTRLLCMISGGNYASGLQRQGLVRSGVNLRMYVLYMYMYMYNIIMN